MGRNSFNDPKMLTDFDIELGSCPFQTINIAIMVDFFFAGNLELGFNWVFSFGLLLVHQELKYIGISENFIFKYIFYHHTGLIYFRL